MVTPFYAVAMLVAVALIVLIGVNLVRLDRRERERRAEQQSLVAPPEGAPEAPVLEEAIPPAPPVAEPAAPLRNGPQPPSAVPVEFSAYYPKEVVPAVWRPLLGYVFREGAAAAVAADVSHQLGDRASDFRETGESASGPVDDGALVTATPVLDGFQVNPPSLSLHFYEDWHRFQFQVRPTTAEPGLAVNGRLTFSAEGVIVADVPLSIFVSAEPAPEVVTDSATRKPYDAIFCCYSRQDQHIVERVERAYKILGLEYLRDLVSIRAGEAWNPAILSMIARADVFQLFWSHAAAQSAHVRQEWEYALSLPDKPANFIRPVFWQQPMPPPPPPLQHIHFAFDDTLDD